jgi:hypothetical protein
MTYAPEYYGNSILVTGTGVQIDGNGSIYAQVGSTGLVSILCNSDVSTQELTFFVETEAAVDVDTVLTAAIAKNGVYADISLTALMTVSERTLVWSLVNDDSDEAVAYGLLFVTYDSEEDL